MSETPKVDIHACFKHNLRRLRKTRNLTQAELGESANVTPAHIGHIERGDREPSLKLLQGLAEGLSVNIGELFVPPGVKLEGQAERDQIAALLADKNFKEVCQAHRILVALFAPIYKEDML